MLHIDLKRERVMNLLDAPRDPFARLQSIIPEFCSGPRGRARPTKDTNMDFRQVYLSNEGRIARLPYLG